MMAKKKNGAEGQKKKNLLTSFHFFENNTVVLAFSFLCAIVVWFVMMDSELEGRGTVVSNVPIQIELSEAAQEAGVRIFDQSYSSTDVSVTGNAMVTGKLTTEDIGVTASLDPSLSMLTGSSMQEATVTLRAYKKGNTLADYDVEGVSPSEVTVVYDKYKEMQLTIDNKVKYTAADSYYASASPHLSTDIVTISGPESRVNKVASAALVYEFSEELTQSKAISCKITLYDINGEAIDPTENYISLSDDTVDVSIAVTSRKTVTIEPNIVNLPGNFSAQRITIDPQTIDITGDGEIISKYDTLTLATAINMQDVTLDNYTFEIDIPLPSGVTSISSDNRATVTFNLNGYTQAELRTENVNVINVPDGKAAELKNKNITVKVVGTSAQISKLTGESISCTIDLSSVTELKNLMELPVTVAINNADSCWVAGTCTAYVAISDAEPSSVSTEE